MSNEIRDILDRFIERAQDASVEACVALSLGSLINLLEPVANKSIRAQRLKDDLQDALDLYNSTVDDGELDDQQLQ